MNILVNASNLKVGGGVQVADSVCRELGKFVNHQFVVVLSSAFKTTLSDISTLSNVKAILYDMPWSWYMAITGRNKTLDTIVETQDIDVVLTIFGPSVWIPKCKHVSGFARPHIVYPNSPFFKKLPFIKRIKESIRVKLLKKSFDKCANLYFTESESVSENLRKVFPHKKIFTVTNNSNQVFVDKTRWIYSKKLPDFDGFTILTISANHPHKNLDIYRDVVWYLHDVAPEFKYRIILTLKENQFHLNSELEKEHILLIGSVNIAECPHLYEQCNAMVLPTLLECFSASYAEAMRMGRPIITTNLEFARGLCGEAALYYDATSVKSLCDTILEMAYNVELQKTLVAEGKKQIEKFDSPEERAFKLIQLIENYAKN